jgi:hypothetical protein
MPSSVRIPAGKKRYTLTLTETTVNRMHAYLGKNHAPKSMLSTMVDELILDVLKTFDELEAAQARKGSPVEVGDFFSAIGKIMTERDEDQKKLIK